MPLSTLGAVADLAEAVGCSWSSLEDIDVPLHQQALSRRIDQAKFESLLESVPDLRSRALALSSALPHAGDWLNAIPSQALGLHIPSKEFSLCLCYWLGLRVHNRLITCVQPAVTQVWLIPSRPSSGVWGQ